LADGGNQQGCQPYSFLPAYAKRDALTEDRRLVVLLRRGDCTFLQKAQLAAQAGAKGVLVTNTEETAFTPTTDESEEEEAQGGLVSLILVGNSSGSVVERMASEGQVLLEVRPAHRHSAGHPTDEGEAAKVFVVNGFTVANARLAPKP